MRKYLLLGLARQLLGVCLFVGLSFSVFAVNPRAERGILDLKEWDFHNGKAPLNGYWRFYDNELLRSVPQESRDALLVDFPKIFNDIREKQTGQGIATYSLSIILPNHSDSLAMEIPQIYSSYELWVDETLIASNGKVGVSEQESVPQWMPQTVSFLPTSDTINIRLLISNFHHNIGGIKEPIFLGTTNLLQAQRNLAVKSILAEAGILILIGVVAFFLFIVTATRGIIFYFSMLCISWAIRALFSNLYVSIAFYPEFSWNAMIRIEYITLYLTMTWAILFLGRIFAEEGHRMVKYFFVGANIFFIVFTLFIEPLYFTKWLPAYLIMTVLLLIYALIVIIRALVNERAGVWYLTLSISLGICIYAYDLFVYQGVFEYNPIILSTGYILIFSMLAMALLYKINVFKNKKHDDVMRFEDYYKTNKSK